MDLVDRPAVCPPIAARPILAASLAQNRAYCGPALVAEIDAESRARKLSKSDVVPERLGAASGRRRLRRGALVSAFHLAEAPQEVLKLMLKHADVPMSFADACLVRMTDAARAYPSCDRRRFPHLPPAGPPDHSLHAAGLSGAVERRRSHGRELSTHSCGA